MSPLARTLRFSLVALAALAFAASASADDRQLLREGSGHPYVMVLLDTSGSMNWAPPCTQAQYDTFIDDDGDSGGVCPSTAPATPCVRTCDFVCPTGDCPVPRDGDDPASKLRQAKEALYDVLKGVTDINFGFASFNQDSVYVQYKQWLYQVDATQPGGFITLTSTATFPTAGSQEVFGQSFNCSRGGGDGNIGCASTNNNPADTNDLWEMTKIRRWPKLDDNLGLDSFYYIRDSGGTYRVRVTNPVGSTQNLGDATMSLRFRVYRCNNPSNGCNATSEYTALANGDKTIQYSRIGDFVKWDYQVSRNPDQGGYDGVQYSSTSNTCNGWDPNTDSNNDDYNGYSLRYPTGGTLTFDPPGTTNDWRFQTGDVLPLDWNSNNKTAILNRLAPRLNGGVPSTDPEAFAVATYLNDHRIGGNNYLRLKSASQVPLMPSGSTPLGAMLTDMRVWFHGCNSTNCGGGAIGWKDFAAQHDPDWECRAKYILLLTDGDETCGGNPGNVAGALHNQDDIRTFVIGYGLTGGNGNTLLDIAQQGGTGAPIFPQNKHDLIVQLNNLFSQIHEETVAFASAAVPTVQADIADKVYLSSFTPLNQEAVWPGRLDSFLKPLPLDANGLPDRSVRCQLGSLEAECFAWDAGDSQPAWDGETGYSPEGMLNQAPLSGDIVRFDSTTLKIGNGDDQRRVFFGVPDSTTAGKRQWFRYPADATEQLEYEYAWNLTTPDPAPPANLNTIAGIVEFTLKQKQGAIDINNTPTNPDDDAHIQYVMGDIFHSNPVVLNAPASFDYYTKDLYWNTPLCGADLATTQLRGPQISYDWFSNKNLCRRVMLFVGSDDGQLHAFDGGIFRGSECKLALPQTLRDRDATIADNDGVDGKYDFGTGREIFSFIPSAQMPLIKELSQISELTDQYGIDGTGRVGDVFIDPVLDASGDPSCQDREWRSVLLGTYRQGGPGLFALDVTQPDTIDTATNMPTPRGGAATGYVPSCIDGGAGCGSLPFPSLLWEFKDTSDEDAVGGADEGQSWSRPILARIQVCDGACDQADEPEDRYVALFGGGLPVNPVNSNADETGNWIYMVDVETGRIIYKRGGDGVISGAVPADITGVDANADGFVDTLYFGTTAGYLYKVELGDGPFELGVDGRIQDPTGDAGRFDPFQVFTTGGRPIYLETSAVFVPKLRANALLFGTGNRSNLWDFDGTTGRFYAIVDTGWHDANRDGVLDPLGCGTCTQPLSEASLVAIDPDSAFDLNNPGPSYLFGDTDPGKLPGWYFPLAADEKLITEPFSLSGITFFTIYDPVNTEADGACAFGGESKLFTVNTVNATGYAVAAGTTDYTRYVTAPKFTTQPFTEQSATGNQGGSGGNNADQWTDELRQINKELKGLFPSDCRFANYTLDIKTIRSDTGIVFIAPVPICIEGHNWKEY